MTSPPMRVAAGVAVLALHAVAIGVVMVAKPKVLQVSEPETVQVRFVELAPQVQIAQAPPAPTPPAEPPKPEPPKPEPPKPEPPKPKPKPKPKPRPEPAPVQKFEPEPVVEPTPEPAVVSESAPESAPSEPAPSAPASGAPQSNASRSAAPDAPVSDTPPLVGQIDYLGTPPKPVYPRHSQRLGETGRVQVKVLVNVRGTVDTVSIERSSGYDRLDESALAAARRSRFKPYTVNGQARAAYVIVPYEFTARN